MDLVASFNNKIFTFSNVPDDTILFYSTTDGSAYAEVNEIEFIKYDNPVTISDNLRISFVLVSSNSTITSNDVNITTTTIKYHVYHIENRNLITNNAFTNYSEIYYVYMSTSTTTTLIAALRVNTLLGGTFTCNYEGGETSYNLTQNLTHCTSNITSTSITGLTSFIITANSGYDFKNFTSDDISITGGVINNFVNNNNSISFDMIPNGNVVIFITANVIVYNLSQTLNHCNSNISSSTITGKTSFIVTAITGYNFAGFTINDIILSGGTISNFVNNTNSISFDLIPFDNVSITVSAIAIPVYKIGSGHFIALYHMSTSPNYVMSGNFPVNVFIWRNETSPIARYSAKSNVDTIEGNAVLWFEFTSLDYKKRYTLRMVDYSDNNKEIDIQQFLTYDDKKDLVEYSTITGRITANEFKFACDNANTIFPETRDRRYLFGFTERKVIDTYSITQNLNNCSSDYTADTVTDDEEITIVLTAENGFIFEYPPSLTTYTYEHTFTLNDEGTIASLTFKPYGETIISANAVQKDLPSLDVPPFVRIYMPTSEQLNTINGMLYIQKDSSTTEKSYDSLDSYISRVAMVYVPVNSTGNVTMKIGPYDTGLSVQHTLSSLIFVASDELVISSENISDFEPYTTAKIYLPFIGFHDIDLNSLIDKTISLKYYANLYTLDCICYLEVNGIKIKSFSGRCGYFFPYAYSWSTQIDLDGNNYYYDLVPKIILEKSEVINPSNNIKDGLDIWKLGNELTGYNVADIVIMANVTENNNVTLEELNMIESQLNSGVIF